MSQQPGGFNMQIRTLVAVITLAVSGASFAQASGSSTTDATATPRLDKRQAKQQQRIDQGVATGQLTQGEAARLEAEQQRNAKAEERAKADGVVTAKERARLEKREDRSSRHIARQKHDRQQAKPAG
jgi:polyisoprenoid-binding protein YceI